MAEKRISLKEKFPKVEVVYLKNLGRKKAGDEVMMPVSNANQLILKGYVKLRKESESAMLEPSKEAHRIAVNAVKEQSAKTESKTTAKGGGKA